MKQRLSSALVALLVFTLISTALVPAQQQTQGRTSGSERTSPPASSSGRIRGLRSRTLSPEAVAVERSFDEALNIIRENYVDGSKLDYNTVFKSSIIGMLRTLDPHSNYYDRKEYEELRTDQRSEYYGIGASIGNQRMGEQNDTFVLSTFEDSPAFRAGLRFGDRIVAVDSVNMRGKTSLEVRDKIRGPRGSTVSITLERAATGRTETVEITRDSVSQPSIPDAYLLKPGVGYIDMTHGFNYTTTDELQSALDFLHTKGMQYLVLDLRNNPGGFLDQAIHVAEKFLQSGQLILSQKGRERRLDRSYESDNDHPDMTPLVILVNGNTASASEIVAGAMQDHDRAIIVGESSFGKGLVQGIFPLESGAGLTLTTAKYYTPSGRLIQRDYSNGGFYNYITRGGSIRQDGEEEKPTGPASMTDTGRTVYGGGGIAPDEYVKPTTITASQARLINPAFFFTRELVNGRIAGFDAYKVQRAIEFNRKLQPTDFPVTDAMLKAFKDFVMKEPAWKMTAQFLDRNKAFITQQLRYNIITAAYGKVTADEVLVTDDPQVTKALELLPRARELAQSAAARARAQR
ncbi:MAG TPA: S41 family peptidase [Pyrinomonadaceae bacterium]|nr:S41 family peptidase [Pyrinomonadaceae bacterium]